MQGQIPLAEYKTQITPWQIRSNSRQILTHEYDPRVSKIFLNLQFLVHKNQISEKYFSFENKLLLF